jgi:hypothetical protein
MIHARLEAVLLLRRAHPPHPIKPSVRLILEECMLAARACLCIQSPASCCKKLHSLAVSASLLPFFLSVLLSFFLPFICSLILS